jgi:hypothetical protein
LTEEMASTETAAHRLPWRPGSRAARLRASHSYRSVLLLVLASFVFAATAPEADWSRSLLFLLECATLVSALWTSGLGLDYRPGLVLVAIAAAGAVLLLVSASSSVAGVAWLIEAALLTAIIVVVGLGVFDQGEINTQSVTGAISIYLVLGLAFTYIYGAVAAFGSGDFFTQGTDGTLSLRVYFSYVTLSTLGYGDYTPATNLGHTLAVIEALMGQLYLVTVVAVLVSRLGKPKGSA